MSEPKVTSFPDPYVEICMEEIGERTTLRVAPNGITVECEIEGVKNRPAFFPWPFVDEARLTVMNDLPTPKGEIDD